MLIKLGIIAGIVILGGMIFSTEIGNIFPTTSATVFDSFMDDVTNFGTNAVDSADQRIDESIDKIVDKTSNSLTNEISEAGNKISNNISEAKESSQKTITEEISNFNPIESITNIFTGGSSSSSSQSSSSSSTSLPIIFDTLSLSTKQQSDDNILLQYSDSSGKTQSVTVVIRTEQKELFSGTFFSSMFETTVNDATGIPYFIDMIVEHEEYGTITSSVFNPGDASDTNINGVFLQS
jgi:gas vesicle protein